MVYIIHLQLKVSPKLKVQMERQICLVVRDIWGLEQVVNMMSIICMRFIAGLNAQKSAGPKAWPESLDDSCQDC